MMTKTDMSEDRFERIAAKVASRSLMADWEASSGKAKFFFIGAATYGVNFHRSIQNKAQELFDYLESKRLRPDGDDLAKGRIFMKRKAAVEAAKWMKANGIKLEEDLIWGGKDYSLTGPGSGQLVGKVNRLIQKGKFTEAAVLMAQAAASQRLLKRAEGLQEGDAGEREDLFDDLIDELEKKFGEGTSEALLEVVG